VSDCISPALNTGGRKGPVSYHFSAELCGHHLGFGVVSLFVDKD
jgi:hypothetical protein